MLLYLFKMLRLKKMKNLLEPRLFNNIVKVYYANKQKRAVKKMKSEGLDPSLSRVDNNFIMRQIVMNYAFRVTRLIIIVFSISYFLSIFWYIFTWLLYEYDYSVTVTFYDYYGLDTWRENEDTASA